MKIIIKHTSQEERNDIMKDIQEWLKGRPEIIAKTVSILPPDRLYRHKTTGQICAISSYYEDGTISFDCTGIREVNKEIINWHWFSDRNLHVFGDEPENLEEWKSDKIVKIIEISNDKGLSITMSIE